MAVRTWVGHFGISRGQAQEMGPFQGAFTRVRPGDEQVDLYVLVHPALPASEEFCGQIVAVIGRLFERQSLSLTGDLLKAIGAAHDNLRDWNRKSLREHQVGAGITCLVLRENLAYLAQAGPSLAFHKSGDGFRRLTPEDPEASAVVGLGDTLRPHLTRFELAPGDLLLFASPTLSDIADDGAIEELFAGGGEQILSELYLLTRDQEDFSAFLLVCFEEPETEPAALMDRTQPGPEETREEEPDRGYSAGAFPPPGEDTQGAEEEEQTPGEPTAFFQEGGASSGSAAPARAPVPAVDYGSLARPRRVPVGKWLAGVLALALIAVAAAWCLAPSDPGGESDGSPLMRALESYAAALAATSLDEKRALLEEAEAILAGAEGGDSESAELQDLRLDVAEALAEIDSVYEINDARLLADLGETGADVKALAAGGDALYALDAKNGRALKLPLSGETAEAEVILTEGDFVGVLKAARPAFMTWCPDADGGQLLVLDSERHLFSFPAARAPQPMQLRDPESLGTIKGLACDGGALYVLDTDAGRVWRYLSTEGGFASEPTLAAAGEQTENAIDIAVSDGDVYLLMRDGTIRRFSDGAEKPFVIASPAAQLKSPSSLVATGQGLLVVDSGNRRIVLLALDGRFERQFTGSHLGEPRAVAVDEVGGRLYVLDGNAVYESVLPALQEETPGAGPDTGVG
ncbi:MAG: hypothetical protein QME71_05290 [Dehalococcoidia bacterium]|nr:hypothetical protein [Dehalococcoidia bacterium]